MAMGSARMQILPDDTERWNGHGTLGSAEFYWHHSKKKIRRKDSSGASDE